MTESVATDQLDNAMGSPQRNGARLSEVGNPGAGEGQPQSPSLMSKHQQ